MLLRCIACQLYWLNNRRIIILRLVDARRDRPDTHHSETYDLVHYRVILCAGYNILSDAP
jgi:hypothetical protein